MEEPETACPKLLEIEEVKPDEEVKFAIAHMHEGKCYVSKETDTFATCALATTAAGADVEEGQCTKEELNTKTEVLS